MAETLARGVRRSSNELLLKDMGLAIARKSIQRPNEKPTALTQACTAVADLPVSRQPGVDLRSPNGRWTTRVDIMRRPHFERKTAWLGRLTAGRARQELAEYTDLSLPMRGVTVASVRVSPNPPSPNHDSFVSLILDDEATYELKREHHGAWQAIADLAEVPVESIIIPDYEPTMRVAFIGKTVPDNLGVVEEIKASLLSHGAFAFDLEPALKPPKTT